MKQYSKNNNKKVLKFKKLEINQIKQAKLNYQVLLKTVMKEYFNFQKY